MQSYLIYSLVPITTPTNLKVKMGDGTNVLASWNDVEKSRTLLRGKFQGYKVI